MSEYWKSTPKYWCKHCSTYVRDTKFERTQHDATAKHQGNLKRFLRDLHRGHEREERENQRAKNEVERLNKVVSGGVTQSGSVATPPTRKPATTAPQQASVGERKRQLAQLANMGIAIPEEYRGEMAMAGDWKTMSERVLSRDEENSEQKSEGLNIGVRKRKFEGTEEEEEAGETVRRRGWGSSTRSYPGNYDNDDDLDALLSGATVKKPAAESIEVKKEEGAEQTEIMPGGTPANTKDLPDIKKEDFLDRVSSALGTDPMKDGGSMPTIVFKKRKPKVTKDR